MRAKVNIKAIIFDKDGTLFDFQMSWGGWFYDFIAELCDKNSQKMQQIANALRFDETKKRFFDDSQFIAGTLDETIEIIEKCLPDLTKEIIEKQVQTSLSNLVQKPTTNLILLLNQLKSRNYKLGVVTNDQEKASRQQLEKAKILSLFDSILGCDSGFGSKPSPGPLIASCKILNVPCDQTLMIGDSTHDLIAAKSAGVPSLGVLTGTAVKSDLISYTPNILPNIESLPQWLNSLGKQLN